MEHSIHHVNIRYSIVDPPCFEQYRRNVHFFSRVHSMLSRFDTALVMCVNVQYFGICKIVSLTLVKFIMSGHTNCVLCMIKQLGR